MEREEATTRRGVYRRRLALAAAASLAIHLLLAKGLAITHLGIDVAPDSQAAAKPLTPKRKADFPLSVPRSPAVERPAHERPVEVRIPVPDRRQRPPTPRPPDRNVAERQAEERSEWKPADQPQAARADTARDSALATQATTPIRDAAVSSAAPAATAADLTAIDPAAAARAAAAPAPADAPPVPRPEPAPIASRWRPREVALLERLTAPQAAPASRSARDRDSGAAARTQAVPRTAASTAAASAADASAAEIELPAATATARDAVAPATRAAKTGATTAAATTSRGPSAAADASANPAPPTTRAANAVAGGRSVRADADGAAAATTSTAAAPGRRQAATATGAGTGVAAIDLPAATAASTGAAGLAKPAAGTRPAASSPSSAVAGTARGAASDADGTPTASSGGSATVGGAVGSRGMGTGRTGDADAPAGGGASTPGRAASVASAAESTGPALVAIAAPATAGDAAPGGGRPAPAAIGRFAAGGAGSTTAGSAVARPWGDAVNGADEDGLSVSLGDAAPSGTDIAARRAEDGEGPGAAEALPPARVAAAALPAEGRVRDVSEAFARRAAGRRGDDRHDTPAAARAATMVERGLDFLARSQQKDGRWSLGTHPGATPADAPKLRSDTAATGLALLSFLGAGHDHFDGPHRDTVRRGLEFLLAAQKPDGDLFLPADDLSNSCAWLYSHGIAAIALCEAVGMTGDPRIKPAAEKACGFIAASQHPTRGGWRYTPRSDADLSVSGWMLVAVRSGELGGVKTDPRTLDGVRTLLEAAASKTDSARYAYNPLKPEQRMSPLSTACMTAVGALMRLHTGTAADDPRVVQAARVLAAAPPDYGTAARKTRDSYLWYYASQVLVHTGGSEWDAWYGRLVDTLAAAQESAGPKAGSWDPLGPAPDRWGVYGGRIYVTALHLLALEVPDRHLPTYAAGKR